MWCGPRERRGAALLECIHFCSRTVAAITGCLFYVPTYLSTYLHTYSKRCTVLDLWIRYIYWVVFLSTIQYFLSRSFSLESVARFKVFTHNLQTDYKLLFEPMSTLQLPKYLDHISVVLATSRLLRHWSVVGAHGWVHFLPRSRSSPQTTTLLHSWLLTCFLSFCIYNQLGWL